MDIRTPLSEAGMIHFAPNFQSRIWGGSALPVLKGVAAPGIPVGESWEVSAVKGNESIADSEPFGGRSLPELVDQFGENLLGKESVRRYGLRFPLLIKFLDTEQDLSIQVHPDDALASQMHNVESGKTEMWYILNARPDARVIVGLNRKVSRGEFAALAGTESILDIAQSYTASAGDSFLIPGGTLHSAGAGIVLAEIQQSSDLTYRIYDFDRTDSNGHRRTLHIEQACRAVNLDEPFDHHSRHTPLPSGGERLARCPYFTVDRLDIDGAKTIEATPESFKVIMCVSGSVEIKCGKGQRMLPTGDTVLLPACSPDAFMSGHGSVLVTRV